MRYPTLSEPKKSRDMIDVFGGYNHNLRIGSGEFYDMTNLSSDDYPVISPRSKRGIYATPSIPNGMVAKDALCYVDGGDFIINKNRIPMGLTVDKDSDGNIIPKTLISMGAYVIIMPDKKYINTANLTEYGSINKWIDTEASVIFELCTIEGAKYNNTVAQPAPPVITEEMEKDTSKIPAWIDTSSTPNALKQYSTSNASWATVPTTYIKISYPGIGLPFSLEDGITLIGVEGIPDLASPASAIIAAMDERQDDEGKRISDWIVVKGIIDETKTQTKSMRIQRIMPDMDFVVESGNRLWGCRYGPQGDKMVNEIYASKLGDFKNWNCFMGISTDSYVASVGTDGQFTGAITHLGYPIFFKENCMHKVYGNYPSNYQIQTTACRGVQKGCEQSLAIVNETLYYKARSGVCAYDGSLPTEMSSALGDINYSNAVAGSLGNKYYISMQDDEGNYNLFVYDALRGMWHREDNTHAVSFCNCRGNLYYIDSGGQIKTVKDTGIEEKESSTIKWQAVTGIIGTDSPDKKYISRLDVRMLLDIGSTVQFFIQYNSGDGWEHLFTMTGTTLNSFAVPIRPKRCDHMRLRIEGKGAAKIFSIAKTIEQGSDI